jgi:hypothetical protein
MADLPDEPAVEAIERVARAFSPEAFDPPPHWPERYAADMRSVARNKARDAYAALVRHLETEDA